MKLSKKGFCLALVLAGSMAVTPSASLQAGTLAVTEASEVPATQKEYRLEQYLQLGPLSFGLPAFRNTETIDGKAFGNEVLFGYPFFERELDPFWRVDAGDKLEWQGKEYTWKENKFDIPVGTELVFTLKPDASKVVSSVIINSESYEVTKLQDGTFTWKGFVMPEQDSKMVVTTSDLFDLESNNSVELASARLAYTGDPLAVDFTVNKNVDKTSFKVEYKVKGAGNNTYTEKPFANCDTYIARITRPADGVYAAYEQGFEYTITKAQLIVEAPKVTVDKDGKFVFTGGKAYYINGDTKVELTGGKFVAISSSSSSEIEKPEQNDGGKVKVKYRLPETVLETNFEVPTSTEVIYDSKVATATIQAVGVYKDALTFKNGNLVLPSSSKVSQGTKVTFD